MRDEIAATLSGVSADLAVRLTKEVSFDERLTGWSMRQMSGNEPQEIYSLQEALDFMKAPDVERLAAMGGGGSIGYLDGEELAQWLGGVLGDRELAEAVREVHSADSPYIEEMAQLRALISRRLEQCRGLLGDEA